MMGKALEKLRDITEDNTELERFTFLIISFGACCMLLVGLLLFATSNPASQDVVDLRGGEKISEGFLKDSKAYDSQQRDSITTKINEGYQGVGFQLNLYYTNASLEGKIEPHKIDKKEKILNGVSKPKSVRKISLDENYNHVIVEKINKGKVLKQSYTDPQSGREEVSIALIMLSFFIIGFLIWDYKTGFNNF